MKNKKRWVSIMAGFLALLMLLGVVVSALPTKARALSSSEIRAEIDAMEAKAEELAGQYDEIQAQLSQNFEEIVDVVNQKANIEQQINLILEQIELMNDQINAFNRLIADTQDQLDAETEKFNALNAKYKERIRTMEEEGSLSYWSVLFKANDFADLLDRLSIIQEIAAADSRRIRELSESAKVINESKEALSEQKAEAEESKESLAASQALLDEKSKEAQELIEVLLQRQEEYEARKKEIDASKDALIAEIGRQQAAYAEAYAAEQAAIQEAIRASEEEERRQREEEEEKRRQEAIANGEEVPEETEPEDDGDDDYYVPSTGNAEGWVFPMAYCTVVTSPYGWRVHPITGEKESFHTGIDMAADYGTEIYAARSGIVTTSGYHWSFGNYVVIYHGDGYSTLYAHMQSRAVSEGESVYQGQTIGYVGSTGESTGPHLHYTVYLNGETVNPAAYL